MLTAKEAAEKAKEYLTEIVDEEELNHLRVEEIDRSENGEEWKITLGWVEPARARVFGGVGAFAYGGARLEALPRVYKVLTVDAVSGEVKSMIMKD